MQRDDMSISSHLGMVLLVVVGMATIFAVIIIAAIESRRMDREKPAMPRQAPVMPADKKKG
jgi:hypothetical protein